MINLDNGPECSGHRSQFLKRMVDFADRERIEVRLIYYPPYHSKYNGIERYWGGLERSWNGHLLESIETVLMRARQFVWRTVQTTVTLLSGIYQKGVKLGTNERISQQALRPAPPYRYHENTAYQQCHCGRLGHGHQQQIRAGVDAEIAWHIVRRRELQG